MAAKALSIWWLTSLNGLPDIGDPFDVAAFRTARIPDDQNAFSYLGRAASHPSPARLAAATARDLGGRSRNHDS